MAVAHVSTQLPGLLALDIRLGKAEMGFMVTTCSHFKTLAGAITTLVLIVHTESKNQPNLTGQMATNPDQSDAPLGDVNIRPSMRRRGVHLAAGWWVFFRIIGGF